MKHYPEKHKKAVISKLVESGLSLRQFSIREGINLSTLCSWRDKYSEAGCSLTKSDGPEGWSAEQKFSVVLETATLSEVELSEYCRAKGLYPEQIPYTSLIFRYFFVRKRITFTLLDGCLSLGIVWGCYCGFYTGWPASISTSTLV